MGLLLGVYNDLVKEAQVAAENAVIQERIEVLNKYAELATELLNAEFPNNYEKADVVDLADRLIQRDLEIADAQQKTAEAMEHLNAHVQVARELLTKEGGAFTDATVEKLASELIEMEAEAQLFKEAGAIAEVAFVDEFNKIAGTEFESFEAIEEAVKEAGFKDRAMGLLESVKGKFKNMPTFEQMGIRARYGIGNNPFMAVGAAGAAGLAGGAALHKGFSGGDK